MKGHDSGYFGVITAGDVLLDLRRTLDWIEGPEFAEHSDRSARKFRSIVGYARSPAIRRHSIPSPKQPWCRSHHVIKGSGSGSRYVNRSALIVSQWAKEIHRPHSGGISPENLR